MGKEFNDRKRNRENFITHGPLSIDTFKELWFSNKATDWLLALLNVTYFPSELLLTEEFLEPKMSTIRIHVQGLAIEDALRHNPFLPKKYVEDFIVAWEGAIYNDAEATPVCLEVFLERNCKDPFYMIIAYHKNTPLHTAARYLIDNWNETRFKFEFAFEARRFETRCNSYLKDLGWDNDTLEATPFLLKLNVIV